MSQKAPKASDTVPPLRMNDFQQKRGAGLFFVWWLFPSSQCRSLELSKPKQSMGPVVVEVAMHSVRGEMGEVGCGLWEKHEALTGRFTKVPRIQISHPSFPGLKPEELSSLIR